MYERAQTIATDLNIRIDDLAETALRYILSHPVVSMVHPGMGSVRNVERNTAVGDGEGLPEEQMQRLMDHRWVRSYYEQA